MSNRDVLQLNTEHAPSGGSFSITATTFAGFSAPYEAAANFAFIKWLENRISLLAKYGIFSAGAHLATAIFKFDRFTARSIFRRLPAVVVT